MIKKFIKKVCEQGSIYLGSKGKALQYMAHSFEQLLEKGYKHSALCEALKVNLIILSKPDPNKFTEEFTFT